MMDAKYLDIVLADLPKGRGHVQSGIRPVLVLSNSTANKNSPIITIAQTTGFKHACYDPRRWPAQAEHCTHRAAHGYRQDLRYKKAWRSPQYSRLHKNQGSHCQPYDARCVIEDSV